MISGLQKDIDYMTCANDFLRMYRAELFVAESYHGISRVLLPLPSRNRRILSRKNGKIEVEVNSDDLAVAKTCAAISREKELFLSEDAKYFAYPGIEGGDNLDALKILRATRGEAVSI